MALSQSKLFDFVQMYGHATLPQNAIFVAVCYLLTVIWQISFLGLWKSNCNFVLFHFLTNLFDSCGIGFDEISESCVMVP